MLDIFDFGKCLSAIIHRSSCNLYANRMHSARQKFRRKIVQSGMEHNQIIRKRIIDGFKMDIVRLSNAIAKERNSCFGNPAG